MEDVAEHCAQKLIRRHPHVFGDEKAESADEVLKKWDKVKLSEKDIGSGIISDLPEVLPALLYARKAQRKAASHGFDWPDVDGPLKKVYEELSELEEEIDSTLDGPDDSVPANSRLGEEVGDILFATANVARKLQVDPEIALRESASRFIGRVEQAEQEAKKDGKNWRELDLDGQEHYYRMAKSRSR